MIVLGQRRSLYVMEIMFVLVQSHGILIKSLTKELLCYDWKVSNFIARYLVWSGDKSIHQTFEMPQDILFGN